MSRRSFIIAANSDKSAVANHFAALADELRTRGHSVVVISPPQSRQARRSKKQGRYDYEWPNRRPVTTRDAFFLMPILSLHRPDCTIGNFGAVNLLALATWLRRVPVRISWYHTLSTQIDLDSTLPPWRRRLQRFRKSLVYSSATHLLTNSAFAAADAQRVFGVPSSKCFVQSLSLADPYQCGVADCLPEKRRPRIICAGRFAPSKGQITLVRALAKLEARHEWETLFVGDGPCRAHCEEVARDLGLAGRCKFAGRLAHSDVLREMADAMVSVVPSHAEAFGYVGVESLALGWPVIASAVGGLSEVVQDGYDGFLVPANDPGVLAAKLALLFDNPALTVAMSVNARKSFLERFEQSQLIPRQAAWLEKVVSGKA